MKSVVKIVVGSLAGAAFVLGAGSARAQTVTSILTPVTLTTTDWVRNMTADKFDSSLGTLLSVELSLTASIETTVALQNNSPSGSNGRVRSAVYVWLVDPIGFLTEPGVDAIGNIQPGSFTTEVLSNFANYNLAAGAGTTTGILRGTSTLAETFTAAGMINQFAGNAGDTITFKAETKSFTEISNTGGNTSAQQSTRASATGFVRYTYTTRAIPEPMTLGLLALGAVAGVAARRRK
jgi:hypothetical protein